MPEAVRARVLDVTGSFLVQAPAGSGKTELLTQRYLALLATVETPETVVAITFTKKAAAEMRGRLMSALTLAEGPEPAEPHRRRTWALARPVLARGWDLAANPARLRIQTFDSFCRTLTSQMPWLSRFGAPPAVAEDAGALHAEAALRTLRMVEDGEESVARLLLHLDNRYQGVIERIAAMLARRDQWLSHLAAGREELEAALEATAAAQLAELRRYAPSGISARTHDEWTAVLAAARTASGAISKKWIKAHGPSEQFLALAAEPLLPESYSDEQWEIVEAVRQVLRLATAQLKLLFQERRQVDYAEIAMAALTALGTDEEPTPLAEALFYRIEHLLVDEFQDTSSSQFRLIERLTADWERGDGRTLFLVGDPMQSIYGFREANVGLFLRAAAEGIGGVPLEYARLTSNFRSDRRLIEWFNRVFPAVLAPAADAESGAVPYAPSEARRDYDGCAVTPVAGGASEVADLVERHPAERIAILVRSRAHAEPIAAELGRRGVRFAAVDLEGLGGRSAVRDLEALTRTLLHPADRTAWLAVCRAPWGGATLDELAAGEAPARVREAVEAERAERGRGSLRQRVERLWLRLGGPATLAEPADQDNCAAYFRLLDRFEESGDLTAALDQLYANADPLADGRIQIMTMHKAKGLEFDVVILPGLERWPAQDGASLLRWRVADGELLLGCVRETGAEADPVYEALRAFDRRRTNYERARLLYVACTRAQRQLYLVAEGDKLRAGTLGKLIESELAPVLRPAAAKTAAVRRQVLRRLPAGWETPAPPPGLARPVAGDEEEAGEPETTGPRQERAAGTVAHRVLERVALDGLEAWPRERVEALAPAVRLQLAALGTAARDLDEAAAQCLSAVGRVLESERGRWILAPHAEARCEWALTGVVSGAPVAVVIDRSFVDADGVRWIIDYKTGEAADPAYRRQVERYGAMVAAFEARPIRLGLFYPLSGVWEEWAFTGVRPAETATGQPGD